MKKNGFTLVELLATLVVLGIITSIATLSYNSYIDKVRIDGYQKAEKSMKSSAESFLTYCLSAKDSFCKAMPRKGSSVTLTLEELTSNGFMKQVADQGKGSGVCTGNVIVTNNGFNINYQLSYRVCLKCSDYQSEGCS